jgi:hypothetical protein
VCTHGMAHTQCLKWWQQHKAGKGWRTWCEVEGVGGCKGTDELAHCVGEILLHLRRPVDAVVQGDVGVDALPLDGVLHPGGALGINTQKIFAEDTCKGYSKHYVQNIYA